MTWRVAAIKGLIGLLLATSFAALLPSSANAQVSPWWPGDPAVILGYGCTSVELEPYDRRFSCPVQASHVHEGMDIDLPFGTAIYAGWPGTVVEVGGRETHDYGPHYVKIWLDEGHDVLLGHLSHATVVRGQRVEIGTLVGYVGDLGVSDIPNLDFGARTHGGGPSQSIDPSRFLAFLDLSQMSQSNARRDVNGRIQIVARSLVDGRAWAMDLAGNWTETPGGPRGGFATDPVVIADGRGQLVAFVVGLDGALWTSSQLTSSGAIAAWRSWTSLGRPRASASGLLGLPAVGLGRDGRLHVFVRTAGSTLLELPQSRVGGRWSSWDRSPFAGQVAGDPVVASDSTGALQVLVPHVDGRMLVNRQARGGGPWTGWQSLGAPPAAGGAGFSGRTGLLRDGTGLLEAFVVTANGSVFTAKQATTDRWNPWSQIGWRSDTSVAAVLRPDRRVQVFALTTAGVLLTAISQGSSWTPWIALGRGLSGDVATTRGADGSLLVLSTKARTLVVRSGDPQEFDRPAHGLLLSSDVETQSTAWTRLPVLPNPANIASRRVTF